MNGGRVLATFMRSFIDFLVSEITLLVSALATTEGFLFFWVCFLFVAHCIFPSDPIITDSFKGFSGALLLSLTPNKTKP